MPSVPCTRRAGGHETHPFGDIGNPVADAFQVVGEPRQVGSAFDRGSIEGLIDPAYLTKPIVLEQVQAFVE